MMKIKNPYGPDMTPRLPQDTIAHELELSGKKHESTFVSGTFGTTPGGSMPTSGMKHKSASPPLAGNL